MNLFLDTNIILGYSLNIDPWHYYAVELFKKNNPFYWSSTVNAESNKKIRYLLDLYNGFFNIVKDSLPLDFITRREFVRIVQGISHVEENMVKFDKMSLADNIWHQGGWFDGCNYSEMVTLLDSIIDDMNRVALKNYNYCITRLILYSRTMNHHDLLNSLRSLEVADKTNRLHYPDDEIIIDAHDLSVNGKLHLFFVTSDLKLLEFRERIMRYTDIADMIFIKEAIHKI